MRPLVMDFPNYIDGLTANDRFMFGKSLLAAPIVNAHYTQETKTHIDENTGWNNDETVDSNLVHKISFNQPYDVSVKLPKGTLWYNFFTGEKHVGGKMVTLKADIATIPLFARAGSIIPIGPDVNYATEKQWNNLTLKVFPGANGSFTLYEDENDNYNYENGIYSTIDMDYNNKTGVLTIGERTGSFPGMLNDRKFTIVNAATGVSQTVSYNGSKIMVTL